MVLKYLLPSAFLVGLVVALIAPEPSWVRYLNAALWATTLVLFSAWLAKGVREGQMTKRSYRVAMHYLLLSALFTYNSIYAVRHGFPTSPIAWVVSAILVSLIANLIIVLEDDADRISDHRDTLRD